jgi:glycerophosphoryl diester phosphodiesterase
VKPVQPRIIAHRGASGVALENSRAAFREALRAGVDGIELDIHSTRTGDLVVHHDPELPGRGPIGLLDREAVQSHRLSNGEPVPTLPEVLDLLLEKRTPDPPEVWIEIKTLSETHDDLLLDCIAQSPLPEKCGIHSFDHRIIQRLGAKRGSLRRGILSASYPVNLVGPLRDAGASVLWQAWQLIDPALVDEMHRAGCEVIAWTVNDQAAAGTLAAMGVDAMCGNWPDRLKVW